MSRRIIPTALRLSRLSPGIRPLACAAALFGGTLSVVENARAADVGSPARTGAAASPATQAAGIRSTGGNGDVRAPAGTPADEAGAKDRDLVDDFEALQGTWEREMRTEEKVPYKRTLKQVSGNREYVTYYDADGNVYHAHQVQFRLERYGPVKVFTFFNMEVTEGKDKGKHMAEERSYVYRLTKDEFAEVWGFLPGQETRPISFHVHTKVKNAAGLAKDGSRKEGPGPHVDPKEPAAPGATAPSRAGPKDREGDAIKPGTVEKGPRK